MSEKFGIIIFILCSLFLGAIYLLLMKVFSGSDFILFSTFLFVVGFVIKWFPYVTELSVAGTTIKLKHEIEEARKLLIESKIIQKTALIHFFRQMNVWGGSNYDTIDRIRTFTSIYNEVLKSEDIVNEYKEQIINVLESLIYCCLTQALYGKDLSNFNGGEFYRYQSELDEKIKEYTSKTLEEKENLIGLKNSYIFSVVAIEFNKVLLSLSISNRPITIPNMEHLFLGYNMPQIGR